MKWLGYRFDCVGAMKIRVGFIDTTMKVAEFNTNLFSFQLSKFTDNLIKFAWILFLCFLMYLTTA